MLPLSLRPSSVPGPLRVVLRVGSARPLLCEEASVPLADAAAALGAYARRGEARRAFDGCYMYTLADGCGFLVYAENTSRMQSFTLELDFAGSFNLLSSRGTEQTFDVLPPMHGQLLQALSMAGEDGSQMRCASKFTMDMLSREAHSPPLPGALHAPVALGGQLLLGGGPQQLLEAMLGRALFISPRS